MTVEAVVLVAVLWPATLPSGSLADEASGVAQDAARAPVRSFSTPAMPLGDSLRAIAAQSGSQLIFDARAATGRRAPAVQGRMTVEEALNRALAGSGLVAERTDRGVFVVRPAPDRSFPADVEPPPTVIEDVVVTGSLIRGPAGASPVVTVTRTDMDLNGYRSAAEALQALPQNFGGTGNEGALQNGADSSGTNVSFASGVNLRGLGADATLVLVNGRRMAGSGTRSDFTDLSLIPAIAIDRIEVLLDGASALYGSDAVGGVVNIILTAGFQGGETRLRASTTVDGPSSDWTFGQVVGREWRDGGALLAYEYADREALPVSARPRAGDADLREFGGSDRRMIYSHPGNIVRFDPASGGYVAAFAIPQASNGAVLEPDDFLPGQVNLQNTREGLNVFGRHIRHGLFAAVHQRIDSRLTLSGDLRYGHRSWDTSGPASATVLTVDSRNPWFVSPTGETVHQIAYSFGDDLGAPRLHGDTGSLDLSAGARLDFGEDWSLDAYAAWAREVSDGRFDHQLNVAGLNEALGMTPDDPATTFSVHRDGYFNPFSGDASTQPGAVIALIGSGHARAIHEADVASLNMQVDGPVTRTPGGMLRAAFGFNLRAEGQSGRGEGFAVTATPDRAAPTTSDRRVMAAFAELRTPLVGPANRRAGVERLEMSAALRHERYDDIGSTTNPKLGVIWAPWDDLTFRATWGTSFRAPALVELHERPLNSPTLLSRASQPAVTLIQYGGNPDLRPERSSTRTVSLDWRPQAAPGLQLEAAWFETRFHDRIGRPVLDNILNALNAEDAAPFIRFISPDTSVADRAAIEALLQRPDTIDGSLFPVESYRAIADARYFNTAALRVAGFDLRGRFAFSRRGNAFVASASTSSLLRYDVQSTPLSAIRNQLDTPNHPLSFQGRLRLDWTRGDVGAGVGVSRAGSYHDNGGRRISGWTTVDLQFRWALRLPGLPAVQARLDVQNLFDADPPFYDAPEGIAYDAANANVLGRRLAFELSKSW